MDIECLAIYDAYMNWMGVLQTFILGAHLGGGPRPRAAVVGRAGGAAVRRAPARRRRGDRARWLAARLRSSGSTFSVEQDDVRIRFRCDPWGPLRQWRAPAGWQGRASRATARATASATPATATTRRRRPFRELRGARPLTHGRETLPVADRGGDPVPRDRPDRALRAPRSRSSSFGDDLDDPVHLDVYTDPGAIPAGGLRRGSAWPSRRRAACPPGRAAALRRGAAAAGDAAVAPGGGGRWRRATGTALQEISAAWTPSSCAPRTRWASQIAGLLSVDRPAPRARRAPRRRSRRRPSVVMTPFLDVVRDLRIADAIRSWAIAWRSHGSTFWIEEDDERFVLPRPPAGRLPPHVVARLPAGGRADLREPGALPDLRLLRPAGAPST